MRPFALAAIVLLAGCAVQQPSKPPVVVNTRSPECSDKPSCDAMWAKAQRTIETITRMRVRLVTPERIVTYAPLQSDTLGGDVTRYATGPNAYQLRVAFECWGPIGCDDLRASATNLFNMLVGGPAVVAQK